MLLLLMATGCATNLAMSDVHDADEPASTIRYTAVRAGAQQFGEYSTIDGSILNTAEPASTEPADGGSEQSP